jgi:hypothetical protein
MFNILNKPVEHQLNNFHHLERMDESRSVNDFACIHQKMEEKIAHTKEGSILI